MNTPIKMTEELLSQQDAMYEARAESRCSMGVGCGTSNVCYAIAQGQPDQCCRSNGARFSNDPEEF